MIARDKVELAVAACLNMGAERSEEAMQQLRTNGAQLVFQTYPFGDEAVANSTDILVGQLGQYRHTERGRAQLARLTVGACVMSAKDPDQSLVGTGLWLLPEPIAESTTASPAQRRPILFKADLVA